VVVFGWLGDCRVGGMGKKGEGHDGGTAGGKTPLLGCAMSSGSPARPPPARTTPSLGNSPLAHSVCICPSSVQVMPDHWQTGRLAFQPWSELPAAKAAQFSVALTSDWAVAAAGRMPGREGGGDGSRQGRSGHVPPSRRHLCAWNGREVGRGKKPCSRHRPARSQQDQHARGFVATT